MMTTELQSMTLKMRILPILRYQRQIKPCGVLGRQRQRRELETVVASAATGDINDRLLPVPNGKTDQRGLAETIKRCVLPPVPPRRPPVNVLPRLP